MAVRVKRVNCPAWSSDRGSMPGVRKAQVIRRTQGAGGSTRLCSRVRSSALAVAVGLKNAGLRAQGRKAASIFYLTMCHEYGTL